MNTRIPPPPSIVATALSVSGAVPLLARAESAVTMAEPGGGMVQVIFGLLLVAALLAGSLYLLKRLASPRGAAASLLRVVSGTAVGARERVVILEVGDTWLVLGVAPGHVSKLHELPRQALAAGTTAPLPDQDFAAWLKRVVERRNAG